MPGLVAFGRRWSIGSDDFFIPSLVLFTIHVIWIVAILVALVLDFGDQSSWPKKECKVLNLGLICTILVLTLFSAILELCLTIVSLRGSILNDAPRTGIPYLLYIRLFALILELVWSIVNLEWSRKHYFSCDLVLSKQVMIGLTIWVWLVLGSAVITAWCVFDVAGRSWVKMKRYQANQKEIEHRHPSFKRSGSTQRNWRQRTYRQENVSSWNNRCKILFCCVHNSESSRDSFGNLANLLSEFFRDLDVVPSDIIVGLLLLRKLQRLEQVSVINEKRNNTYEFLSGIAITPNTKFVAMNDAHDLEAYHNVVYYMRYSSAAYGWLWYVIPNGFRGLFNLCSNVKCCFHRYLCSSLGQELSEKVVEDNCCFCNVAVIPTMFDPSSFEIVYATYHVDVGETPFFVVVDYEKKSIVISIRGTLSLKDLMTDLNAEAEPLPLVPIREDWLGHKGMVQAASYLKSKLLGENILDRAFEMCQTRANETFDIVIVGHSLGGGAAAILAILLREQFPTLVCYAYSPPGGLLSMPAVEYSKQFVTSVIVGKDLVPRIGLSQMEALRADLMNAIKKSHTPKWKTIMSGMTCCKCIKITEFSTTDLRDPAQISATGNESSSVSQRSEDLLSPNSSVVSMTMHQPLYPPGRIMHVVRHHPKKDERILGKGEPVFQAIWTENTDYDEVLISPGMIQDHMPHNVLMALNRVTTSLGPAKPQRTLTNNASPMNINNSSSGYGPGVELLEYSSKVHSDASFAIPTPAHGNGPKGWVEPPLPPKLSQTQSQKNPEEESSLTAGMGNIDEECDDGEYVSLAGSHSTETLFSLKISWDYFREFGKYPLKIVTKSSHTRNSSSGSSNTSELGTTMKELFGPIKLYECTVPLASSETLSEISSMSSRASFIIRDSRSPLTKLKLAKNLSLRVHESNGTTNTTTTPHESFNGNGKSHQRSFSCVYPEGKKTNFLNPYGTLNGGSRLPQPMTDNNFNGNFNGESSDLPHNRAEEAEEEEEEEEVRENLYPLEDTDRTPTADLDFVGTEYLEDVELLSNPGPEEQWEDETDDRAQNMSQHDEIATCSRERGRGGQNEKGEGNQGESYSPVYPIFSTQQEYGTECHNSPHYNYCPSPLASSSSSSVHSINNGNNDHMLFE